MWLSGEEQILDPDLYALGQTMFEALIRRNIRRMGSVEACHCHAVRTGRARPMRASGIHPAR
jgi:hypothetical protein